MRLASLSFLLCILVLGSTFTIWAVGGFHTGWTQNQIPVEYVDDITGIETVFYEEGFRAGLDFLLPGLLIGLLLGGSAVFLRWRATRSLPAH